jgi:hypothetical protein
VPSPANTLLGQKSRLHPGERQTPMSSIPSPYKIYIHETSQDGEPRFFVAIKLPTDDQRDFVRLSANMKAVNLTLTERARISRRANRRYLESFDTPDTVVSAHELLDQIGHIAQSPDGDLLTIIDLLRTNKYLA